MRKIRVLDTTLRDGEQAPGCGMGLEDKLIIAAQLERMGVDIIEAGFPVVSEDDFTAVSRIAKAIRTCRIAAFSRAVKSDMEKAWEAVGKAEAPMLNIFLPVSDIHLEHKLKINREELLAMVNEAVRLASSLCPEIIFTAEDAARADREFLLLALKAAERAGAGTINIADTVGCADPAEIFGLVSYIRTGLKPETVIGIHCHNDLGMAAANTLSAIRAGASQFDCTILGIGERAGVAAIEEVVMALRTKGEYYGGETGVNAGEFYRAGKLLSNCIDFPVQPNKPIIGRNAFAHEAGIHQHGMMANPLTYEIMKPEDVGVHVTKMVMGKHSGKAALRERIAQLGYIIGGDKLEGAFARFKELADKKKEINDSDIEKLVIGEVRAHQKYSLVSFVINCGTNLTATASVKLEHDGMVQEYVAGGETPVIAAFNAVDKIVEHSYPLHHFTIQSISEGRTELGESVVQIWNGGRLVTGRGLNTDIVEACIRAYLSAINKAELES